jgi:hypothetical protein
MNTNLLLVHRTGKHYEKLLDKIEYLVDEDD